MPYSHKTDRASKRSFSVFHVRKAFYFSSNKKLLFFLFTHHFCYHLYVHCKIHPSPSLTVYGTSVFNRPTRSISSLLPEFCTNTKCCAVLPHFVQSILRLPRAILRSPTDYDYHRNSLGSPFSGELCRSFSSYTKSFSSPFSLIHVIREPIH